PLAADLVDLRRQLLNCFHGLGINSICEAGGKAHRAQHAELIFGKAAMRLADGADDAGLEVTTPPDKVEDLIVIQRIEQQAVDGEITPLHIFFGVSAE